MTEYNEYLKHPVIREVDYTEDTPPPTGYEEVIHTNEQGRKSINYDRFARAIIEQLNLISYRGMFFNTDGEIPAERIRHIIAQTLSEQSWTGKFDSVVNSLITTVRDLSNREVFSADKNTLYFQNGELDISSEDEWIFYRGRKTHTPHRLNCNFISDYTQEGLQNFYKWLNDLFETPDKETIHQMLGNCLVPVNKVQEAFILVGGAGSGKSVLTHLLYEIFGKAYVAVNLTELDENRFILANIENKLVVYDDDLQTRALTDTGNFKKLITSEQPIKAERKGQQPYMFTPYATVIANTNQMIQALYDDSAGFFRRLHPIVVREKDENRQDIFNMNELVTAEKDNICAWAVQGLWILRHRHYKMHWSDSSRKLLESERNPLKSFFDNVFEITGDEEDRVSQAEIIKLYKHWCKENISSVVLSDQRVAKWLNTHAKSYNGVSKLLIGRKRLAGFKGLKVREAWR